MVVLQELETAQITQGELEVERDVLWAQLRQCTGCLELASKQLQDVVIAWMATLSKCPCVLDFPVMTFPGWAQEHRLLLDRAAMVLASLQEGQQSKLTTPRVEWGMNLLGRMVLVHQRRNVPALRTWFKWVFDEGKPLPSWDQLLEKASWEQALGEVEEEGPQKWPAGSGE